MRSFGLLLAFVGAVVGVIGLIMGYTVHLAPPGKVTVDMADRPFRWVGAGAVLLLSGLIFAGNAT